MSDVFIQKGCTRFQNVLKYRKNETEEERYDRSCNQHNYWSGG